MSPIFNRFLSVTVIIYSVLLPGTLVHVRLINPRDEWNEKNNNTVVSFALAQRYSTVVYIDLTVLVSKRQQQNAYPVLQSCLQKHLSRGIIEEYNTEYCRSGEH
jgi:hypothetical protein